ncbi:2161_t:CDS:1, partial [Funneliformis caledonium]
MQELKRLIIYLSGNDQFSVDNYIYIDDKIEGILTDKEILEMITNKKDECNKKDEFVDEII